MKKVAAVLAVSLLPACGGKSPAQPPPPPPTTLPSVGQYTLTVTPSTIIATPSGDPDFPWNADWRVTITDVSGLSAEIKRVLTTAKNNFGFTFVWSDFDEHAFISGVGTNHISRNGELSYRDGGIYRADGNGGQQMTLTIAAELIDQRGNQVNVVTDVRVTNSGSVERLLR
jgi:hypothetical protein